MAFMLLLVKWLPKRAAAASREYTGVKLEVQQLLLVLERQPMAGGL